LEFEGFAGWTLARTLAQTPCGLAASCLQRPQ
jgi:hypothetical protein